MYGRGIPDEFPPEVDALASQVVDSVFVVRKALGVGLREELYKRALSIELTRRGIEAAREVSFDIEYEGVLIGRGQPDFLIGDSIVLEAKASRELTPVDFAQTMTYLRITRRKLAFLVNFHAVPLGPGIRRLAPPRAQSG